MPSVKPLSVYGVVAGSASVLNPLVALVLCSTSYVNPEIVVQLTVSSVSDVAVTVTPVGAVGSVHTPATLLASL